MSKPVVFVIGATGNVGSATVKALSAKHASRVEIRAGVRNPEKADQLKSLAGVSVVKAEMGSEELETTLKGVDALFIVTPGVENRAELAISTATAAKKAGVKHLAVVSGAITDRADIAFGKEFAKIEKEVKALGPAHTFIRLPFFVDNYWAFMDTIKGAGAIYNPVDPTVIFGTVVVADAGNAAASVLVDPANHASKCYTIVSDRHSHEDIAAAFREALGKSVTYHRISYEDTEKALLENGISEWHINGLLNGFKLIDMGDPEINSNIVGDYQKITGEQPTSLKAWVSQVKAAFE